MKDLFRKHLDRRMCLVDTISRPREFSNLFWQTTETVASTDPHLCRTGFLRKELARSQCRQAKETSWRLALSRGATKAFDALGAYIRLAFAR